MTVNAVIMFNFQWSNLNRTTRPISPIGLCPILEAGIPARIQEKIHYTLKWKLAADQQKVLKNVFSTAPLEYRSINQCLDPVLIYKPIFTYLEVKKTNQSPDPTVQLAIWIAAGFNKNKEAGYDMMLPMPAISVIGDQWYLWVAFWNDGEIVVLRPTSVGTMLTDLDTYQILATLASIGQWGICHEV